MIDQCKHGHSVGVAHINCPYCRIEVLEAELAAIKADTIERCAKAVEGFVTGGADPATITYWGLALAKSIRALGDKP